MVDYWSLYACTARLATLLLDRPHQAQYHRVTKYLTSQPPRRCVASVSWASTAHGLAGLEYTIAKGEGSSGLPCSLLPALCSLLSALWYLSALRYLPSELETYPSAQASKPVSLGFRATCHMLPHVCNVTVQVRRQAPQNPMHNLPLPRTKASDADATRDETRRHGRGRRRSFLAFGPGCDPSTYIVCATEPLGPRRRSKKHETDE